MSTPVQHTPHRHAYSVDDYYRMAEAGILRPGDRVGLIEGEIIDRVPIGSGSARIGMCGDGYEWGVVAQTKNWSLVRMALT